MTIFGITLFSLHVLFVTTSFHFKLGIKEPKALTKVDTYPKCAIKRCVLDEKLWLDKTMNDTLKEILMLLCVYMLRLRL
jgi:hypothetical protein